MKVEIIKKYRDISMNMKLIEVGTVLAVSTERGNVLIEGGVAKEIKEEKTIDKELIKEIKKELAHEDVISILPSKNVITNKPNKNKKGKK